MVINLPILGWKNLDLSGILKEQIRLPCFVENDANAAAFGALYTEPALPSECTIFLKIGTGCGGAAIINGRLFRGAAGTAGEFGHIQVAKHSRRCSCGQLGCLEASVNLAAIASDYKGSDDLKEEELLALPAEIARSGRFFTAKLGVSRTLEDRERHLKANCTRSDLSHPLHLRPPT
jgi:predicted NBD/HSP70 family sugar kinase